MHAKERIQIPPPQISIQIPQIITIYICPDAPTPNTIYFFFFLPLVAKVLDTESPFEPFGNTFGKNLPTNF
jgi:hypothetical protein